jgi:hypothetical protein
METGSFNFLVVGESSIPRLLFNRLELFSEVHSDAITSKQSYKGVSSFLII